MPEYPQSHESPLGASLDEIEEIYGSEPLSTFTLEQIRRAPECAIRHVEALLILAWQEEYSEEEVVRKTAILTLANNKNYLLLKEFLDERSQRLINGGDQTMDYFAIRMLERTGFSIRNLFKALCAYDA